MGCSDGQAGYSGASKEMSDIHNVSPNLVLLFSSCGASPPRGRSGSIIAICAAKMTVMAAMVTKACMVVTSAVAGPEGG